MPLRATINGEPFWAWNLTKHDRGADFRCPICDDEFIVVLPTKNIVKHFRHKNGNEHWEPETPEHLSGKQIILEKAIRLGYRGDVEVLLFGQYIADVFLEKGRHYIAVELQCSSITSENFFSKDTFYLAHDIFPLWILGGHYFLNTRKYRVWKRGNVESGYSYKIQRLSKIERLFLEQPKPLYYYGNPSFYEGRFKRRWQSKVLGWYTLKLTTFRKILKDVAYRRWFYE